MKTGDDGKTDDGQVEVLIAEVSKQGVESKQVDADPSVQDSSLGMWAGGVRVVRPPKDPARLIQLVRGSSATQQCIQGYVNSIHGTGATIIGVVDPDTPAGQSAVSDAMYAEAVNAWLERDPAGTSTPPEPPTPQQVEAECKKLRGVIHRERLRAEAFIGSCHVDGGGLLELRKRSYPEFYMVGYRYWEVVRDTINRIIGMRHAESPTMRIAPESQQVKVKGWRQISILKWENFDITRRFNRFVQSQGMNSSPVWFKEFGDPRVISRSSGKLYADTASFVAERRKQRTDFRRGGEIHMHRQVWPGTPYGLPLWIGCETEIVGTGKAANTNLLMIDNKYMPPVMITIAGGTAKDGTADAITSILKRIREGGEMGLVPIIQMKAQQSGEGKGLPPPKIEVVKLVEQILQDALLQTYTENNDERIGRSFRLPPLLRGIVKDVNRANAFASMLFGERQVFAMERREFDSMFTGTYLKALDLSLVRLQSNPIQVNDPAVMMEIVNTSVERGILMPGEARPMLSLLLETSLDKIDEWWMDMPPTMALAQMQMGIIPPSKSEATIEQQVKMLGELVEKLRAHGRKALTDDFREQLAAAGIKAEEMVR